MSKMNLNTSRQIGKTHQLNRIELIEEFTDGLVLIHLKDETIAYSFSTSRKIVGKLRRTSKGFNKLGQQHVGRFDTLEDIIKRIEKGEYV